MDKKVEVFGFWWQVWEALDEESKEACRKELKEDYENALESIKEGKMICTGPCADELPDYDEDGEALCTKANFLRVLDIE